MSTWDNLQQVVEAIPTKGIKREIAEAILLHYSLHLAIYERATLLKGDLTKKKDSEDRDEGKQVVATTGHEFILIQLTLSKSFAEFTCENCHCLQAHLLSQAYGIPAEKVICYMNA